MFSQNISARAEKKPAKPVIFIILTTLSMDVQPTGTLRVPEG
jgi:hypothetical protein